MRPIAPAVVLGILIAAAGAGAGAAGRFDVALAPAKQPAHVLNRLGFGPRATDLAEIRRMGVERWIRQQLDAAAIPDSPALTARLAPLESQKLATWQIFEQYQPAQPLVRIIQPNINQLLPADQLRRLMTGPADERRAIIEALAPEARQQVLIALPPNVLEVLPELKQQQERARQIQNEVRAKITSGSRLPSEWSRAGLTR